MAEEIELKLRLTTAGLRRLRAGDALARWACGPVADKHLESTYYDTPDLALGRRGMVLRVRRDGGRRVQTLKAQPADVVTGDPGLQRLTEYEAELAGDEPDPALVDDPGLQRLFAEEELAARLRPIFRTDFHRRVMPLAYDGVRVEAALDQGRITADGRTEPLAEVEFELQSGTAGRLYALALELLESVPFRLEPCSKAARGYALAAGRPAWTPVPEWPDLDPATPLAEAVPRLIRGALPSLRDPEAAAPAAVDEAVIRLAATIAGFRPWLTAEVISGTQEELARLEAVLTPARAWWRLQDSVPAEGPAAEALRRKAHAAWARALAALTDRPVVGLLLRLQLRLAEGTWLAAGTAGRVAISEVATDIVVRIARELRALEPSGDGETAEDRARLAHAVARLRALAEGLPHARMAVDREMLGQLDAAAAAVRDLAAGAESLACEGDTGLAGLEAQVRARLAAERHRLADAWAVFAEQAPQANA